MTAHNGRDVTSTVDELAARTPDTRDRYVDFLRAVSILAVVFGHWMIMIIWWQGGLIRNTSAIGVPKGVKSGSFYVPTKADPHAEQKAESAAFEWPLVHWRPVGALGSCPSDAGKAAWGGRTWVIPLAQNVLTVSRYWSSEIALLFQAAVC